MHVFRVLCYPAGGTCIRGMGTPPTQRLRDPLPCTFHGHVDYVVFWDGCVVTYFGGVCLVEPVVGGIIYIVNGAKGM